MIRILHHLGSGSTCYARTALDGVEPSPLVCLRQSSSDLYLDGAVDADGSGDHDDADVDDNDNDENDDDGDDGDDGDDDDVAIRLLPTDCPLPWTHWMIRCHK